MRGDCVPGTCGWPGCSTCFPETGFKWVCVNEPHRVTWEGAQEMLKLMSAEEIRALKAPPRLTVVRALPDE